MPGAGVQGQTSHQNGLFGAWLPLISSCQGIAPHPTTPSSLHQCRGTQLQRCRWAAQRAIQQSLSLSLCCRMKPIQAGGWICSSMHREKQSFLLLSPLTCPCPQIPWLHHLYPFLTWVFYSLSGFSCLLPFPQRKFYIKEFFSREEVFG